MTDWEARRSDDDSTARTFASERETRDWINSRTMPWEFYAVSLNITPDPLPTNLDDARAIVAEIQQIRAVQTELRSAFARRELDGGARAAFDHPLYLDAVRALESLHDRLTQLI